MYRTRSERLLDFLLPSLCLKCGRPGFNVCARCKGRYLPEFPAQQCHVCGVESRTGLIHRDCRQYSNLDGVLVSSGYSDLAKQIMKRYKFKSEFEFAKDIADVIVTRLSREITELDLPITFVPSSKSKIRDRGFNQAEQIARRVAKLLDVEVLDTLLRTPVTETQVGKGVVERSLNVIGQYRLKSLDVFPQGLIIVDDVMTTGSTLEACAAQLKLAGLKRIYGVVFARNPEFALDNMV